MLFDKKKINYVVPFFWGGVHERFFSKKITSCFFGFFKNRNAVILLSIFVSVNCCANNGKNLERRALSPDCAPYCEKINFLFFAFVGDVNIVSAQQKKVFLSEIENIFVQRRPDMRISFVDRDKVERYYHPTASMVFTEIHFYQDKFNKSVVKIRVNMVMPNRYFSDEFICSKSEGFSCINEKFKNEISKNIEDYFFKPSNGMIL